MDGGKEGRRKGKIGEEKEGQDRREIKGGVDNKVDNKKSEKLIVSENKEREREKCNGKNKKGVKKRWVEK